MAAEPGSFAAEAHAPELEEAGIISMPLN